MPHIRVVLKAVLAFLLFLPVPLFSRHLYTPGRWHSLGTSPLPPHSQSQQREASPPPQIPRHSLGTCPPPPTSQSQQRDSSAPRSRISAETYCQPRLGRRSVIPELPGGNGGDRARVMMMWGTVCIESVAGLRQGNSALLSSWTRVDVRATRVRSRWCEQ